jgi:hypothetical protein
MGEWWDIFNHVPSKYKGKDLDALSEEEQKEIRELRHAWSRIRWNRWDKWSEPRAVEPWGICDKWKAKESQ